MLKRHLKMREREEAWAAKKPHTLQGQPWGRAGTVKLDPSLPRDTNHTNHPSFNLS
jgi:hypothetical protein